MARVTIPLPNSKRNVYTGTALGWRDTAQGLGDVTALRANGAQSSVINASILSDGRCSLHVADGLPGSIGTDGQDLSVALEQNVSAIIYQNDHIQSDLVLPGPDYPGNRSRDSGERYSWVPPSTATARQAAWITAYRALRPISRQDATRLILDDGVPVNVAPSFDDATGDAISGETGTAIADIVVPEANGNPAPTYSASGLPNGLTFDTSTRTIAGTPTAAGRGTITVRASNSQGNADWTVAYAFTAAPPPAQPLALSDLAITGRRIVSGALLQRSTADPVWYATSARGGTDAPLDGSLVLESGYGAITRVYLSGTQFRFNDNSVTPDLGVYFASGGMGHDLQMHVMNDAKQVHTVTISALTIESSGNNFVNFTVPQAFADLMNTIDSGERWILAFSRVDTTPALPVADAPDVTIDAVASVREDATQQVQARVSGGTYDALAYAWSDGGAGGTFSDVAIANPVYTPPDVAGNTEVTATCEVTAIGRGTVARDGTRDTASDAETFTVTAVVAPPSPPSTGYGDGLSVTVGGVLTLPHQGRFTLRRSLADGSSVSMTVRGILSNLTHIQDGAEVVVTDIETGATLFSGHGLRGNVNAIEGGDLVDLKVTAAGIEQRPYSRLLTFANARAINTSGTARAQLAQLVAILGSGWSVGQVHANVNPLSGVVAGTKIGALIRQMGDAQRVNPDGSIDLIMREGLVSTAMLGNTEVTPRSRYTADRDTTTRRVIAYGAPVKFIATGTLRRITESGVTKHVATVAPPAMTEIESVDRVVAQQTITSKFDKGDELDGVWDPDRNRFEWSGAFASATDTAVVEVRGVWRTEDIVDAAEPDSLAQDQRLDVPLTNTAAIRAAATRELENTSQPIERMAVDLVFGSSVPRLDPGDAVLVALSVQNKLNVHQPQADTLWLVHAVRITQPGPSKAQVALVLSRRLPDNRERDYWSRDRDQPTGGGRQIVIGSGSGAPRTAQVIPEQRLKVGGADVTLALGGYFSDPDGDVLTYVAASSDPTKATVAEAAGVLTLSPVAAGTITVTVTASDASRSTAQQFTVVVAPNRAPVRLASIPTQNLFGRAARTATLDLSRYFRDPDGEPLTYQAVSSDQTKVSTGVDGARLTVTYVGAGSVIITVTASDGLASVQATFAVNAVANRAPYVVQSVADATVSAGEGNTNVVSNIPALFADPDGDALTYSVAFTGDTSRLQGSLAQIFPSGGATNLPNPFTRQNIQSGRLSVVSVNSRRAEVGDSLTVTITASDGDLSVSEQFTVTAT